MRSILITKKLILPCIKVTGCLSVSNYHANHWTYMLLLYYVASHRYDSIIVYVYFGGRYHQPPTRNQIAPRKNYHPPLFFFTFSFHTKIENGMDDSKSAKTRET